MSPDDRPTQQDLDKIIEALRPKIESLAEDLRIPMKSMEKLLGEALFALAHRWRGVPDRAWWLRDRIEKAARRSVNPSPEEPRDDEQEEEEPAS
jgi:hypothetical protein